MSDLPPLPGGYEPHELPAYYTGPLFIEGQMRAYARAAIASRDEEITRLRSLLAGMVAIEDSVTQGQERELKDKFVPLARAALKEKK